MRITFYKVVSLPYATALASPSKPVLSAYQGSHCGPELGLMEEVQFAIFFLPSRLP